MTDWEDSPAHETAEQAVVVPEAMPSEAPPTVGPLPVPAMAAPVAAANVPDEPPFLSPPVKPEPDVPEDLRALQDSLEQPTGAIPALVVDVAEQPAAAVPAEGVGLEAAAVEDEATGSLDDIAPGTIATELAADADDATEEAGDAGAEDEVETRVAAVAEPNLGVVPKTKVSWWPFVGYIVVWLAASGYTVYQLQLLPAGQAAYETDLYRMSVLVGLSLLAAGPALLIIVWFASWIGRKRARVGSMFISALIKGATATLIGAIIWMGAIMLTDYLRLGRPF